MSERILIGTKQVLKLVASPNLEHLNAGALAVPDMTRVELIHSDDPLAQKGLEWLRVRDVRILSTVTFEEYFCPELDGKRTPELLKEYGDRATKELIDIKKTKHDLLIKYSASEIGRKEVEEKLGLTFGEILIMMCKFRLSLPKVDATQFYNESQMKLYRNWIKKDE